MEVEEICDIEEVVLRIFLLLLQGFDGDLCGAHRTDVVWYRTTALERQALLEFAHAERARVGRTLDVGVSLKHTVVLAKTNHHNNNNNNNNNPSPRNRVCVYLLGFVAIETMCA